MFSIQSAMCDGKYFDRSEREVNQTDSVGELADSARRRSTKSSNYFSLVFDASVMCICK